jgi:hypothetical protein
MLAAQSLATANSVLLGVADAYLHGALEEAPDEGPSIPEAVLVLDGYDAAMAIADERREKLKRLREALLTQDDGTALRIAAALCGLKDED